jgi:K+-sensing histidine kinase KdpD
MDLLKEQARARGATVLVVTHDHRLENYADRIFETFYTTKTTGTGMGLAISRGIIEEHGGRIGAESPPGSGATFAFRLPVETKNVSQPLTPVGDEG